MGKEQREIERVSRIVRPCRSLPRRGSASRPRRGLRRRGSWTGGPGRARWTRAAGAFNSGRSTFSAASASWSAAKRVSWVSFFLGFFFVVAGSAESLPKRYLVRSATGSSRALSPFTSTTLGIFSRWMPSPWAIFRAASNSSKKPLIFAGLVSSSASSSSAVVLRVGIARFRYHSR